MRQKISVILPVHNTEKELVALACDCLEMASDVKADCEIVIIDDASTDTTHDIAESLSLEYPQIKIVAQWQNHGLENAIIKGLQRATGNLLYVYYMSSGHAISQIPFFYDAMSFADVILGRFVGGKTDFVGMGMFKRQVVQTLGNRIVDPEATIGLFKEKQVRYLELRYEKPDDRHDDEFNMNRFNEPTYQGRLRSRPATFIS